MRKMLILLLLLAPLGAALAQGVSRSAVIPDDDLLVSTFRNGVISSGTQLGGGTVPGAGGFVVTKASIVLTANSGGGAGDTVATCTDGTNTCTLTWSCSSTGSGAVKILDAVVANGAGTGCAFPASARVNCSGTTAGCTTTQPTIATLNVRGRRR